MLRERSMNYFYQLPKELQEYIHYINNSWWALMVIKKNVKNQIEKKESLIPKLIWDLRERNNCWKFRNPMIDNMVTYPQDIDTISPHDKYTYKILEQLDKLIIGNEFFGNKPIVCIYLWNRFLWAIAMGLWDEEYSGNYGNYSYYDKSMEMYYNLRIKLAKFALINDISILNLAPSLVMEKFDPSDFID